MKKLFSVLLVVVLLVSFASIATAESDVEYKNVKITYNGEKIILLNEDDEQQQSIIVNGQVYVPIEEFIFSIGGEYSYSSEDNLITINLPSSEDVDIVSETNADTNEDQFEDTFVELKEQIDALYSSASIVGSEVNKLWKLVGSEHIVGVYSIIVASETAKQLESSCYSGNPYHFDEKTYYKNERVAGYYDILALEMGYGTSRSTFKAGSSIPHDATIEMFEYTQVLRSYILGLLGTGESLSSQMKEFNNNYGNNTGLQNKYSSLLDYYVEVSAMADFVINLVGNQKAYEENLNAYRVNIEKLSTAINLY